MMREGRSSGSESAHDARHARQPCTFVVSSVGSHMQRHESFMADIAPAEDRTPAVLFPSNYPLGLFWGGWGGGA